MKKLPISILSKRFGNLGRRIWLMAQGLDRDPVQKNIRDPKSLGHGKVMPPNTKDEKVVLTYLQHMCEKVGARLRRYDLQAQTFFIGVKSHAWGWLGSKAKLAALTQDSRKIYRLGREVIMNQWDGSGLFQIQVTALDPIKSHQQQDLFERAEDDKLHKIMDVINERFGNYTLTPAPLLNRTKMHDVIAPAWKPGGVRKSV